MKRYTDLINECLNSVKEMMPWDLEERLNISPKPLLLDVREPYEYEAMHIEGSLNVPRGILETACEYDYEETLPDLVEARDREIIVVCRSGNRSVLAAFNMQLLGYVDLKSLKTGLRGWNDYEQPLVDIDGHQVPIEKADEYFTTRLRPDQLNPKRR